MDLNKVVKICTLNLMNLVKNTLIHFRTAKTFLLLGRIRKPSALQLSWEHTYREMAPSNENWSDWEIVINDGLGGDEMKAKIKKYTGIADIKLSTKQIMNLTRE